MTQPHQIDREAVAEPSNETCQFDAGQPVSNLYKFDAEIAWLKEAARYFSNRPTGGEDAAHWSNVYNAENANKIASRLDALSRRPAPEAGFLGHLVVPKSGVGAVFIGKGEPVPLMGHKGRVVPVYDGPQNVTANDPMEAVAWRWRLISEPGQTDMDWSYTSVEARARGWTNPDAWEVQALALISTHPVQGGEG